MSAPVVSSQDMGLEYVVNEMLRDKKCMWNSIDLFHEYTSHGGCKLTRKSLIQELQRYFEGELLVLSSPEYAHIVSFSNTAASILHMVKGDDDKDINKSICKVAKQVANDCKDMLCDKTSYNLHIDKQTVDASVYSTLQKLLGKISPKFTDSLPAALIGNIVTSMVKKEATDLQIALGVLLRDSRTLVEHMHDYRVTCSYDELLRFKKSAAVVAASDLSKQGISDANDGLVQVVCDNFDADISSQNGKLSTHSLAMIITQTNRNDNSNEDVYIYQKNPKG